MDDRARRAAVWTPAMARCAAAALLALLASVVMAALGSPVAVWLFVSSLLTVIVLDGVALRRYLGHWPGPFEAGVMQARLHAWDLAMIGRALRR